MARTNFSGPINQGNVQQTTDTKFTANKVRNLGLVTCTQRFYFDHQSKQYTVDDDRIVAASTSSGAQTLANTDVSGVTVNGNKMAMSMTITSAGDGDWHTGSTWVGNEVPGSGDDVTIAHAVTINTATLAQANSLTVNASKSLTISVDGKLTVVAGVTNNGSLVIVSDVDESGSLIAKAASNPSICLLYTSPSPRDQRGSRMRGSG